MIAKPKRNLRHYQRVSTDLHADIQTEQGAKTRCKIINMSRTGLMLQCTPAELALLMPNLPVLTLRQPIRLRVVIDLMVRQQPVTLRSECDIIYTRRLSKDIFQLGIQFVSFFGDGQAQLDAYIDASIVAHSVEATHPA